MTLSTAKWVNIWLLFCSCQLLNAQTADQLLRVHNITNTSTLNNISSPLSGNLAYTQNQLYYYDGSQWRSSWATKGNNNIENTDFLGTTDNTDLSFRTDNVQRMVVKNDEKVGVNLNNPIGKFQVNTASSNTYIEISTHGVASCNNGHNPGFAIDNDPTVLAWDNGWAPHFWSWDWLMIDLTAMDLELPVVRYTLRSPNLWQSPFHSNITIWELEGSLDGVNWTGIHGVNSNTFTWDWGTVTYNIPNNVVYNRYRLFVHAGSTEGPLPGVNQYYAISDFDLFVRDTVDFTDDFIIATNGQVGVGIAPTEDLHVNGNILASGTITPDYVFESYFDGKSDLNPTYKFQPLSEVEQFIKENKHLPGVPSAQDIEEQGGILVNKATEINLEKIEELYIHLFELIDENERIKKSIKRIEKEVLDLAK
jgi:hypothetical protein